MAHLGQLTNLTRLPSLVRMMIPTYYNGDQYGREVFPPNVSRTISGVITADDVPAPDVLVALYTRDTWGRVAITKTNAQGEYSFNRVRDDRQYLVLAWSTDTQYNAQVRDYIEGVE